MLTFEEAKELFIYDRDTGVIKWRRRTSKHQRDNLVVGYTRSDGYTEIKFKGKPYLAHRIAMLLSFGFCDDELEVDHINHIRDDNRLANLRFVTRTGNRRNLTRNIKNASGVTGVFYLKNRRKYTAQITIDSVQIYLGIFSTLEEAAEARKQADIKFKFNANHGSNKAEYVRKKANA